jgi:hypothetical protein
MRRGRRLPSSCGRRRDGSGPGRRQALLRTGVPDADIDRVTLLATGPVGVPGSCVITTIR